MKMHEKRFLHFRSRDLEFWTFDLKFALKLYSCPTCLQWIWSFYGFL